MPSADGKRRTRLHASLALAGTDQQRVRVPGAVVDGDVEIVNRRSRNAVAEDDVGTESTEDEPHQRPAALFDGIHRYAATINRQVEHEFTRAAPRSRIDGEQLRNSGRVRIGGAAHGIELL